MPPVSEPSPMTATTLSSPPLASRAVAMPSAAAIDEVLADERAAVETKYNNEVLAYRTKPKVQARHILKALPADASDADVAKARGVLLDLKSQIEGGADFGGLADEVYPGDEPAQLFDQPGLALVVAVVAHGIAEQAAAHADT